MPASAGEKAVVANADEAVREDMKEKTAQELQHGKGEFALLVTVFRVAPAKGDLVLLEIDEAVIGNGDAVRIPAQVAQNLFGAGEGWFAVDHPFLPEEGAKKGGKGLGLRDGL